MECRQLAVLDDDGIIGVAIVRVSSALDRPSRSVVCVRQEHPFSSTVADYLISDQVRYCSAKAPCRMLMIDVPTHPITRRVAIAQGFQHVSGRGELAKIALGQPVTKANWNRVRLSIERLAGLGVQKECPRYDKPNIRIASNGDARAVQLYDFETLLSPTLLALPKRSAVIVPITRSYAADLLGTDRQFSFLEVPEAHFLTRRTYFNTIRASRAMIRGAALAFYESKRGGGRGAIVALGRIVDSTSIPSKGAPELLQRGGVVDDFEVLTKSSRVLATTFDNLVALRNPVSFEVLRQMGCVTKTNLVSATPITDEQLAAIVDAGYSDG